MCVAPIARFCESRYNARPPESPLYKIHFVVSSNANTRSQHTLHHNTTLVVDVEFAPAPERHIHTLQLAFLFRHRLRCSRFYINFSLDPRVSFPSSLAHPPTHAHTHTLMAGGGVATEGGRGRRTQFAFNFPRVPHAHSTGTGAIYYIYCSDSAPNGSIQSTANV